MKRQWLGPPDAVSDGQEDALHVNVRQAAALACQKGQAPGISFRVPFSLLWLED